MVKTTLLIILTIFLLTSTLPVLADENCVNDEKTLEAPETQVDSNCSNNNNDELFATLFNYTKSEVNLTKTEGIKIYTINQNNDSRYNMGYALGKAVMINNPEYAKELRTFIDLFTQQQSEYTMEDVIDKIAKIVPCWILEEMKGFAKAASVNNDNIKITLRDILILNTVVLWTRLPKERPQAPPAAPTSVTPIETKNILKSDLSPVSKVADQRSILVSLDSSYIDEDFPVVVRSYERLYNNFFDRNSAIMIYQLDNITFMSVGFEGLISVLSGLNQYGVVINTIQSPNQKNIKIIGATPPTINNRITIESATSAEEGNEILENQNSSLEQISVIVDNDEHYALDSQITNIQDSEMREFVTTNKIVIYNFSKDYANKKVLSDLNRFKNLETKIPFKELLDTFSSKDFFKTSDKDGPNNNTIFTAIYNVKDKKSWVIMPRENTEFTENKYLIINLKDYLQAEKEEKKEETDDYLKKYDYEEVFGEQ